MNDLNYKKENDPNEDDTLGSLVNKLSISTIQMWDNQDILYKIRFMNEEEFVNEYSSNMSELHKILKRCCDLNVQRSKLIDQIDKTIYNTINMEK